MKMNKIKKVVWHVDYYDHLLLADLFDEGHIEKMLSEAKASGVDTIFWRVSVTGQMSYHTKVCTMFREQYNERDRRLLEILRRIDPLDVAIRICRKLGLEIFVYVSVFDECIGGEELKFMSDFIKGHPECLLVDREGKRSDGLLCYAYKEARDYRIRQIEEILEYEPDGIFLEMRSHSGRYRSPIGFNEPLADEYRRRTGKEIFSHDDFDYFTLMRIHGEYLTELYRQIGRVIHNRNKQLAIGVSFDDFSIHAHDLRVTDERGLGWLEVPSRVVHIDWRKWIEEQICDILVVGAGGIEISMLDWDDVFRVKYLPVIAGKGELWVWQRFFGWHGSWKLKPKGAILKQFEDVASAMSISGVVWHEAYDWYREELSEFLWTELKRLKKRIE